VQRDRRRDTRLPVYHSRTIEIEIGAKLRELRLQAGMSQEKFGRAMGLSHAQVQKYEQGKNRIAVSTLVGICEVLGANPMDFFDPYFRGSIR
jgi:transcriptional regulator with XRE-family HTH domain